jgi:hypothetical protein
MERMKNKRIFRSMMLCEKRALPKSLQNRIGRCEVERGKSKIMAFSSNRRLAKVFLQKSSEKSWGRRGAPLSYPDRTRWFSI